MRKITLDAEAGRVSGELIKLGIPNTTRVHVVVDVIEGDDEPPIADLAHAGRAFDWLADEPDLYSDADLRARAP